MERHMRQVHFVEKSFGNNNFISFHRERPNKPKKGSWRTQSTCTYCNKSFSTKYKLKYHIRDYHKKEDDETIDVIKHAEDMFASFENIEKALIANECETCGLIIEDWNAFLK